MRSRLPFRSHLQFAHRYVRSAIQERRREAVSPIAPAPERPDPSTWPPDRLTAAWLGHSTVLMNFFGVWIITDPALEARVGLGRGMAKFGPRRLVAPALLPRELPPLDLVLLSHAHMDHTDLGTLARLPRSAAAVVQPGNLDLVRRFRERYAIGWTERATVRGVEIESLEVSHWGARMITDRHRGYGGFLLRRGGRTVLFSGDTADTDALTPVGRREPIDLAIMPIGAYDPWIANHASPEQTWRMFQRMGARYLMPVHFATFRLSREPVTEPLERLHRAAGRDAGRIVAGRVGATWQLPEPA